LGLQVYGQQGSRFQIEKALDMSAQWRYSRIAGSGASEQVYLSLEHVVGLPLPFQLVC